MKKNGKQQILKYLSMLLLFSLLIFNTKTEQAYAATVTCKVTFSGYSGLNKTVTAGKTITLPTLSSRSYTGWRDSDNVYYNYKDSVVIKASKTFYPVNKKNVRSSVQFLNPKGGTNAGYQAMGKSVAPFTAITLPSYGSVAGYKNMGWTTVKGATKPLYKCGSTYTVNGNINFYAVRAKIYQVSFADTNGTADTAFQKLRKTGINGTVVTLPKANDKLEGDFIGWSRSANATAADYKAGTSYTIRGDVTLYAVYRPMVELRFYTNDRIGVRKVRVTPGTKVKMGDYWKEGYTMMGWATTSGLSTRAGHKVYEVGETITLRNSMKLFAVTFDRSKEKPYSAADIPALNTSSYSRVIFVGDSRTNYQEEAFRKEFSPETLHGYSTISKPGKGLAWLMSDGYPELMRQLSEEAPHQKPVAVIFNFGVNDLVNADKYMDFMKAIAPDLKKKNCVLFYMSVNPASELTLQNRGITKVAQSDIIAFNARVRAELCKTGLYQYIDTYTELYNKGFAYMNRPQLKDDGLHYSVSTYVQIYAYCIRQINAYAAGR